MQAEQLLRFGPHRLDPASGQLWRGTHEVKLTPKALAMLCTLVTRAGQVVTKDELFQAVWPDTIVSDDALTSCVQELRQALRDDARKPRFIETVHRRGYRFLPAITTQPVQGSTFNVPSQEEEANQKLKGKSQKEKSEDSLESSVQSPESNGQSPGSSVQSLESKTLSTSPDDVQTLDARPQTLDGSAPTRLWSSKSRILAGMLLLTSTVLIVHYLSRSTLSPQSSALSTQAPQALPLPDKPSIAVMPFTNMSGDPEQDYFSDGITDTLITDLSKISGLFVIARYSVFTYKGKAVKVGQISQELGVRYVLEGSIQKADGQVRINVQLVDATTGRHLWAERYDRPLKNLFALQDDLIREIIAVLHVEVLEAELKRVQRVPSENLTAYDLFLRGLETLNRVAYENSQAANEQARHLFEKALTLEPTYAAACAALAWTYFNDWFFFWNFTPATLARAATLAQQAVVLDNSLPFVHSTFGWISLWQKKYEQAIAEFEQALILDPNWADAYARLGYTLDSVGRPEEGSEVITKAMRLNPRYPDWYLNLLGSAYRNAGRYEEALVPLQKAVARNPDFAPAHINLAICYAYLGRQQEAEAEGAKILQLWPMYVLEIDRQYLPYKNPVDLERYLDGLRKAGLK